MDYINELHELCESISHGIAEANEKIRAAGGKLAASDVDYLDKITHTLKSIKSTIAMMEDEDGGYSSYDDGMSGGSYENQGGSYENRGSNRSYMTGSSYRRNGRSYNRGGSYARGRGRYANRDSMGRYSSDDGLVEELRGLMNDAPNDQIKREMQTLMEKIERQM